jgi:DNA-binding response OmpR family regulator
MGPAGPGPVRGNHSDAVLACRAMPTAVRVLVVDDSEPVRALLAKALRQQGFTVYEAETGIAALRLAFDVAPAVAIVDQWMPGMTGAELIRLLRAAPRPEIRGMAIIGLSGRPGSEKDLLGAGAGTFLAKPFGEGDLRAALRAALGPDAGALPA